MTAVAKPGSTTVDDAAGDPHRDALLAQLEAYRARLAQLEHTLADLAAEPASMDSPDEEDAGDADGSNVERDRLAALALTARRGIEGVQAALTRVAAGTYGVCERCGQRIPDARLEAVPEATHCVGCKTGGLRLLRGR
jgi:DnaK suppressor protein